MVHYNFPRSQRSFVLSVLPLESNWREKKDCNSNCDQVAIVSDVRQIISTELNRKIRREFDRKIHGDTNEWLCRVGRENMRILFVTVWKSIDRRDNISLFAHDATCARNGDKFGRIDVGTIILTLTLIETRPRTESGNYVARRTNSSLVANKPLSNSLASHWWIDE